MIDLKYILNETDYLQLNLYFFDIDGYLEKNSRKTLLLFIALASLLYVVAYLNLEQSKTILISAVLIMIFVIFIHKKNMKRHYKRMFEKNIQHQYNDRFGKEVELRFTETNLEVISIAAKTQFNFSQIKSINETNQYYFIRLKPEAVIIPKSELQKMNNIKENLVKLAKDLNIEYKEDLSWKW